MPTVGLSWLLLFMETFGVNTVCTNERGAGPDPFSGLAAWICDRPGWFAVGCGSVAFVVAVVGWRNATSFPRVVAAAVATVAPAAFYWWTASVAGIVG